MPIDPTPIVYSMGVGRSSIKITHGRLSSRHLCQLPPPALEGAWVKVEEIIGRGGAATRRSKSLCCIISLFSPRTTPHLQYWVE
eukprot:scaffold10838_cov82-Phaeocystis_antarctica.AAC.1